MTNIITGLSFIVGTADYNVVEVDGLQKNHELFGQVTYDDATIVIEPTLCKQRKHNVIVHELVHAMLFEAGYDEHDEEQVRRLGNTLTQVLCDNIEVFAEMFENETEDDLR